ncbi:PDZ domain-containing protein [bacterium]|nr:PDZ domain-containing protein [bacterium]
MPALIRLAIAAPLVVTTAAFAEEKSPTAAEIAASVEQLGAEQFSQRESASKSLASAGQAALAPLGDAIGRDDLEVASRAIEIVCGFLDSDDEVLAGAAEKLLEAIAEGPPSAVTRLADGALEFHHRGMTQATREKLEALGAVVSDGMFLSGNRGLQVILNTRWRGTSEDLRLLSRLQGVRLVGAFGVPLDAAAVAALGRLHGVEAMQLYGTGISDELLAALTVKLPHARIDVRKGGKLGVGGQPMIGPCVITQVQEGSAAAKAGMTIGDVVISVDGTAVATFEALTTEVGRHGAGDTILLEIDRPAPGEPARRFKTAVVLDGWE